MRSDDINELRDKLEEKVKAFNAEHGHDATIEIYFDGSGEISDLWGNAESFDDIFDFRLLLCSRYRMKTILRVPVLL